MLDLAEMAEMAKKVDDGEFKTCIEISEGTSSDSLVDISPQKEGYQKQQQPQHANNNNGSCSSTSNETPPSEREGETKTPDDAFDDTGAGNDEDERSSIANSSIDSDIALHTPATPTSSLNGGGSADASTSSSKKNKQEEKASRGSLA